MMSYQQWRSHIGAIGAAAPVENFLVTFPIRPDPLSFFNRGGWVRTLSLLILILIAPYLLLILIAPVGIKSWLRYCSLHRYGGTDLLYMRRLDMLSLLHGVLKLPVNERYYRWNRVGLRLVHMSVNVASAIESSYYL